MDTEAGCAEGSEREFLKMKKIHVVKNVMNEMKKAMRARISLPHKTIRLLTTC
jgi:hypothetical protein